MKRTAPDGGRRAPAPHRTALKMLIVFYTIGLAGTASLLVSRTVRFDWHHLWAAWTQPPVHHAAGYVPARLPTHLPPLPPAPALRHAPRVIAWYTPQGTIRHAASRAIRHAPRVAVRGAPVCRPAYAEPLTHRAPHRAPRVRGAQRPSPALHQRTILLPPEPPRAPMPTWAHPPDPTLPPECRPKNPVVVGQ